MYTNNERVSLMGFFCEDNSLDIFIIEVDNSRGILGRDVYSSIGKVSEEGYNY